MTATCRSIIRFSLRAVAMALCVVAPAAVFYIWLDPFKVVRHYSRFYADPETEPLRIGLNKGVVTLSTYIDNSDGVPAPYNAFIFGSSISCYYDAAEWRGLLEKRGEHDIRPFHFDSSSETPMSMARKVEYLHNAGAPLDYALIVLDPIVMGGIEEDSPYSIDPVEIRSEPFYPVRFHYTFFRGAVNADFFKSLIASKITGKRTDAGRSPIFETQPIVYDRKTNQESIPQWDSLISVNPKAFYEEYPLLPPADSVKEGKSVLSDEKIRAFERIADVFGKHGTDCRVIVSPNRRGVALSHADLEILQKVFGKGRVHDFSASHAGWLRTDTMLYDNTHYRPPFASMLMREVYLP